MKTNKLAIKQLDKQFTKWQKIKPYDSPKNGWIQTIRKALGITTKQLAKKLNVNRSRIIRIESDEEKKALTMKTMITAAEALNCDFVYAFIPRESLQKTIENQAYKKAIQQINSISHNMALESQTLTPKQIQEQIETLKNEMLDKPLKNLWNEE